MIPLWDDPRLRASFAGCGANLLWSSLALLTVRAGKVPPLQLAAMMFTISSAGALIWWRWHGQSPLVRLRLPWTVWALGLFGLFGYHALYFVALQSVPVLAANLLNYLWPLLIVLGSALLPANKGGGGIGLKHVLGALLGFGGAALVFGGNLDVLRAGDALGLIAALGCAVVWAIYSVLSRLLPEVPSDAVGGFCGVTALLAWAGHCALEPTLWPADAGAWAAVMAAGLGPVGLAFFAWDHGMKHGNIRLLGAASYATPLLSTLWLVAAGGARLSWALAAAAALIVAGVWVAAGGSRRVSTLDNALSAPNPRQG
ncbi:MAG: DMT family transporter [Alphaproteobacteria bacterium]|nr:DMT family transporter [Alphaproteobacteria bacterium]